MPILVFDVLDEVDLIKFAFCFQEHWDDSLYENRRTVYIDCIDSVKVPGLPSEVAKHGPTFYEPPFRSSRTVAHVSGGTDAQRLPRKHQNSLTLPRGSSGRGPPLRDGRSYCIFRPLSNVCNF